MDGNPVTVSSSSSDQDPSTAACDAGDSLISGYFDAANLENPGALKTIRQSSSFTDNKWIVDAVGNGDDSVFYKAFAICFNNP